MNCSSLVGVFNKCFLVVTHLYNNKSTYNNSFCGMVELLFYNIIFCTRESEKSGNHRSQGHILFYIYVWEPQSLGD
jgi:hypothetical protein